MGCRRGSFPSVAGRAVPGLPAIVARGAQPFPAGDALAQTVAQALGKDKAIPVVVCAAAPPPLTLGLLHPRVVLPREDYSWEALAGILCHELAHWQGGHLWGKLLLLLARGIHWFNPLVHLAARRADIDLELACDDRVLAQATPAQRKAYAHTLLSVMEADTRPAVFLTTQLQGGKHVMKARFYNLFHPVTSRWGKLLLKSRPGGGAAGGGTGVLYGDAVHR